MRAANVAHGMRGPVTSSTTSSPTAHRSPIECRIDVEPGGGQVLAEGPLAQADAEPALPVVELFAGECVDGLVVAPVVLGVADEVADQAAAQPAVLGARRAKRGGVDRAACGCR